MFDIPFWRLFELLGYAILAQQLAVQPETHPNDAGH
jgi:hypothetical protein